MTTNQGAPGIGRIRRSLLGVLALGLLLGSGALPAAASSREALRAEMTKALQEYLSERRKVEMISGVSAFVSLKDGETGISAVAGTTRFFDSGERVTRRTLYEIGSNTKQMTAAVLLQLEAKGLLDIEQTVGDWLPQYKAWAHVSIRRLLNMTSGIPTYTEAPRFMDIQASRPNQHFTPEQLIAFAYPTRTNRLPTSTGWFYSNTNYILAGMIAEKASGRSMKQLYQSGIFDPLYMKDSYYEPRVLPESVIARMSSGYFNNPTCGEYDPDCSVPPLAPLVGKDMRRADVSWTGAAGGVVSTPRDLQRWVRGLFGGRVLPPKQLKEMLELVSTATGEPIRETTAEDPRGFGLGMAAVHVPGPGQLWFYEGMTLGYRAVYFYFPKDDLVVTAIANSQAPDGQDELPPLALRLYEIVKDRPAPDDGPEAPEDFD
ncbi:serine hydrolase domain-containing protein [Geminicoccus flavidas]|uniref:serine hydrolase domain-containing protein n=1 Tax=Geminicoccus flavidas TaxID=2506407 RepID=UPI00135797EB|nr:serine hydrolase domain-containing protein [Geminicoccus flavidas]